MTLKQQREYWIQVLKRELVRARQESKATKKDIGVVLEDFLRQDGDYTLTKQTKLYNKHGGEYCQLLEIINYIDKEGKFESLKANAKRVKKIYNEIFR